MKNDPMVAVIMGAATLKRMAPVEFDLFLRAVKALADSAHSSFLAASPDSIFQAQGKAQTLDQLAKKLEDCMALEDQYRTRR
jgi:hypothetical protein